MKKAPSQSQTTTAPWITHCFTIISESWNTETHSRGASRYREMPYEDEDVSVVASEVSNLVERCRECSKNALPRREPLLCSPDPEYPWQMVRVCFVYWALHHEAFLHKSVQVSPCHFWSTWNPRDTSMWQWPPVLLTCDGWVCVVIQILTGGQQSTFPPK